MDNQRKVIVFIGCSLDGYIAKPNDDLSFLSIVDKEDEDYGYTKFISTVDTVILGRKTYDWVMKQVPEFPHADKESYIITHTPRPAIGKTQFYTGDLKQLISDIKSRPGKNIFIDGGAEVVNELMKEDLVDEYIISFLPILVGSGIRLFKDDRPEQLLEFIGVTHYEKGLVQVHYRKAYGFK